MRVDCVLCQSKCDTSAKRNDDDDAAGLRVVDALARDGSPASTEVRGASSSSSSSCATSLFVSLLYSSSSSSSSSSSLSSVPSFFDTTRRLLLDATGEATLVLLVSSLSSSSSCVSVCIQDCIFLFRNTRLSRFSSSALDSESRVSWCAPVLGITATLGSSSR
jgi:hypothetical protein